MSGGKPQKNPIEDVLELIRGAFVLHTRGYNVPKPLEPTSNFARLYTHVRQGAEQKLARPVAASQSITSLPFFKMAQNIVI